MRLLFLVVMFLFTISNKSSAQGIDLGSWNIVNLKYTPNEKWSAFAEAQLRSLQFYGDFHYYEYKGGVNYKYNKNMKLTLGMGSYQTYKEGGNFVLPKNNDEFRLWPQLTLFQSIGKFKIEQRYRAEFRFTSNGYRNRFRYRPSISLPFGKTKNNYKPFQVSVSNELFFTDKEHYFERNRLQYTFNIKTSKATTLQLGYLHQLDYKINDETGRKFFVVGFYYELFKSVNSKEDINNELKDN
jgi:hypothetical protein